jgi:hypothetical protein
VVLDAMVGEQFEELGRDLAVHRALTNHLVVLLRVESSDVVAELHEHVVLVPIIDRLGLSRVELLALGNLHPSCRALRNVDTYGFPPEGPTTYFSL